MSGVLRTQKRFVLLSGPKHNLSGNLAAHTDDVSRGGFQCVSGHIVLRTVKRIWPYVLNTAAQMQCLHMDLNES